MNWELYGLFLLTGLAAAGSPGPSIAFTVSQSIRYGALRALPSVLGLMLASVLFGVATLAGAGTLLIMVPEISIAARILGAGYLMFLGYKQITTTAVGLTEVESTLENVSRRSFIDGLLIGLSNPKIMLFYLMFIPQFVDAAYPAMLQITILVISQYMIKAAVLLFYIAMASSVRRWLSTKERVAVLNKVIGGVLICAALMLVVSAALDLRAT